MCCASVISSDGGSAISATKSLRTWLLTEVRGMYLILKAPNIVPYGAILPVAYAMAKMVSPSNDRYLAVLSRYVEC